MAAHRFRTIAKANTTARGYGAEHRAERNRRVAERTPASPCSRCGKSLGHNTSDWHLPHNPSRTGYEPGMWCAPCNRSEGYLRGGAKGRASQQAKRTPGGRQGQGQGQGASPHRY